MEPLVFVQPVLQSQVLEDVLTGEDPRILARFQARRKRQLGFEGESSLLTTMLTVSESCGQIPQELSTSSDRYHCVPNDVSVLKLEAAEHGLHSLGRRSPLFSQDVQNSDNIPTAKHDKCTPRLCSSIVRASVEADLTLRTI